MNIVLKFEIIEVAVAEGDEVVMPSVLALEKGQRKWLRMPWVWQRSFRAKLRRGAMEEQRTLAIQSARKAAA